MTQKTDSEKIKTCFRALGISDDTDYKRAYEVLFAELARLGSDERLSEQKKVEVRVLDDDQKLITETILSLIEKQVRKGTTFQSQLENIRVKVQDYSSHNVKPEDVINLGNFDYVSERDKLVSRCNASIIGNSYIKDILEKEEIHFREQEFCAEEKEAVQLLKEKIGDIDEKIYSYENRIFVLFRKFKIEDAYEQRKLLIKEFNANKKRYQEEKSYRVYVSRKRVERIEGLNDKEDILEGIKYLFTGRREELVKTTDENGKTVKTFVLKPQEDYDSPRERKIMTEVGENNSSQISDSSSSKTIEYSDIR